MPLTPRVSDADHIKGDIDAAIELVEYGDYQCPHCGRAYPIVKAILQKFANDVKLIFRHFPLSRIHPQTRMASIASEAAAMQGKFWEMHDITFENQRNLTTSALLKYAEQIGLNAAQFENDLKNDALAKKVDNDFVSGLKSGVNRTPGFYINGMKYEGQWDEQSLGNFIQSKIELLKEQQKY